MPQCPQCNKPLLELTRQCPSCRADLDLLVDYVRGLQSSLGKAADLTRAGELGPAVVAYLQVLEVDPDNPEARRQVGQVATAVRQFDRASPTRRWAQGLPLTDDGKPRLETWMKAAFIALAVIMAFGLGFLCAGGWQTGEATTSSDEKGPPEIRKENRLGK